MATLSLNKDTVEVPRYHLLASAYLGEIYYREGDDIDWDGMPGNQMEPLNDAAVAQLHKYKIVPGGNLIEALIPMMKAGE